MRSVKLELETLRGSCLIIYSVNLNLICHIFRRFTEQGLNLCSYFFNIPVCYTLLSDNVRGISAIKTVSEDITRFLHFCTDFLPRGKAHSVGVKKKRKLLTFFSSAENWYRGLDLFATFDL